MTAVPVDRDPDNEVTRLVALARATHEQINLTEDGHTVAIVIGVEEFDGLLETADILSTPGEAERYEAGRAELDQDLDLDGPTVAARYLRPGSV